MTAFARFSAMVLLAVALSGPAAHGAEARQDSGGSLAAAVAAAASTPPVVGPADTELAQAAGFASSASFGVDLADVLARAAFAVPDSPGASPGSNAPAIPWDIGMTVRMAGDREYRVIVDSTGTWHVGAGIDAPFARGAAAGLRTETNATNTLDVLVQGDLLELAVNGQFAGATTLPPGPARGDIAVGTGFLEGNIVDGRVVPVTGFQVWDLAALTLPPPAPTAPPLPPAEVTPVIVTPTPDPAAGADAEAFAAALALQAETAPLAGPFSANLKEEANRVMQSWAGVSLADFSAGVTFVNPAPGAVPWDYGIVFRSREGREARVAMDASGTWGYFPNWDQPAAASGLATDADLGPGGRNRLDLVVRGDRAWLGVNGTFLAAFDLAGTQPEGDVGAAAAIYTSDVSPGRVTAFENFAVWPAPPAPQPAPTTVPMPPPTAAPPESNEASEIFVEAYLEMQARPPDGGPVSGELVQPDAGRPSLSDTVLDVAGEYVVTATFANPATASGTPWDYGFALRLPDGDVAYAVVVDSLGAAYLSDRTTSPPAVRALGPVSRYDAAPGAGNTLQLAAVGGRAVLVVNGWTSAPFDLPAADGGIQAIAGLFNEDFAAGRAVLLQSAEAWSLAE